MIYVPKLYFTYEDYFIIIWRWKLSLWLINKKDNTFTTYDCFLQSTCPLHMSGIIDKFIYLILEDLKLQLYRLVWLWKTSAIKIWCSKNLL